MQPITPHAWQLPLIDFVEKSLAKNRFAISGFPTGSGKTVISLEAAKRGGGPHLLIVPKVSVTQWQRTAEACSASQLVVDTITAQSLVLSKNSRWYKKPKKGETYGKWSLPLGTTCIWDEPHRSASGEGSQSTFAMAILKAYPSIKLHCMSATLADSPRKLRATGYWAGLHEFCDGSYNFWLRKNGCRDERVRQWDQRARDYVYRAILQFTKDPDESKLVMENIRKSLGDRFMSLKASEIPGFPTETIGVKLVDLETRDRAELDRIWAEASDRVKSSSTSDMGRRLREREQTELLLAPAIAELAQGYAEDGMSVVIGWNFTEPRLKAEELLRSAGLELASVYGGQKDADRQAGIDLFQANRLPVISVMAEAGGASLSLHDTLHATERARPRVSLLMPGENSSTVKQFLGRTRRDGGGHATQYLVLAAGTVMERVAANLDRKLRNMETFNECLCDQDLTM